ncbi:MAG: hypothetical protein WCF90_04070 [Methanomicrobiales archaeon]
MVRAPALQRPSAAVRAAARQLASITITIEVPEDNLEIHADPLLVKVFFFYNLFDNTRQFSGEDAKISISHRRTGTGLIQTVEDNEGDIR